ncbi:hypothetical protein STENM327S_07724 [Streptomyces tendae]
MGRLVSAVTGEDIGRSAPPGVRPRPATAPATSWACHGSPKPRAGPCRSATGARWLSPAKATTAAAAGTETGCLRSHADNRLPQAGRNGESVGKAARPCRGALPSGPVSSRAAYAACRRPGRRRSRTSHTRGAGSAGAWGRGPPSAPDLYLSHVISLRACGLASPKERTWKLRSSGQSIRWAHTWRPRSPHTAPTSCPAPRTRPADAAVNAGRHHPSRNLSEAVPSEIVRSTTQRKLPRPVPWGRPRWRSPAVPDSALPKESAVLGVVVATVREEHVRPPARPADHSHDRRKIRVQQEWDSGHPLSACPDDCRRRYW